MIASLALSYLAVSIGVGIAALLFFIIHKKLRSRYSARSLSVIWITMACCLLLPFGSLLSVNGAPNKVPIEITVPLTETSAPLNNSAALIAEDNHADGIPVQPKTETVPVTPAKAIAPAPAVINWPSLLGFVWTLGIAVFSLYHGLCYILLRRSIRRYSVECPESIQQAAESVQQELPIRRPIRIRQYGPCKSPFLIGVLRPMIIIPENLAESLPLELVIKHELIHYKNHDIPLKLLALVANILHFYNPMAYVIRREIALSRELVCDQQTLQGQDNDSVHAYGNAILSSLLAKRQTAYTTQFGSSKTQMKERLSHMLSFKNKKKGIALVCAALVITVFSGTAIALNIGGKTSANEADSSTPGIAANTTVQTVSIPESAASVEDIPVLGNTDSIKNIMLIGVDMPQPGISAGRSDGMVLLTIDEGKHTLKLTSFPRDIYMPIPNHGDNRLNAAYATGGYDLLSQTIKQNFRLNVDQYMTVDFNSFPKIVDSMNGVDIALTDGEATIVGIGKTAGVYHLNGEQALTYSRIRIIDDSEGNQGAFGRDSRLRKMLQALLAKAKTKSAIELTNVMSAVFPQVATNISSSVLLNYINKSDTYLSYAVKENSALNQSKFYGVNVNQHSVLAFNDKTETILELQRQIYN